MTKDGNASDPIEQLSSQASRRLLTSAFVIKASCRWKILREGNIISVITFGPKTDPKNSLNNCAMDSCVVPVFSPNFLTEGYEEAWRKDLRD